MSRVICLKIVILYYVGNVTHLLALVYITWLLGKTKGFLGAGDDA